MATTGTPTRRHSPPPTKARKFVILTPLRSVPHVFGLRGFYDTARIFYRPIHNEVVLPLSASHVYLVQNKCRLLRLSVQTQHFPQGFNLHLLFDIFIPSSLMEQRAIATFCVHEDTFMWDLSPSMSRKKTLFSARFRRRVAKV